MRFFDRLPDGRKVITAVVRRALRCGHLSGFWVRLVLDDEPTPDEIEARLNAAAKTFADSHDCRECERP